MLQIRYKSNLGLHLLVCDRDIPRKYERTFAEV
jgi:hypothetical protein